MNDDIVRSRREEIVALDVLAAIAVSDDGAYGDPATTAVALLSTSARHDVGALVMNVLGLAAHCGYGNLLFGLEGLRVRVDWR